VISIVVPLYNEERVLQHNRSYYKQLSLRHELIFVDGGSTDRTKEISSKLGSKFITAQKGRARQMNAGALEASHKIILFLHADTQIDPVNIAHMVRFIEKKKCIGGCFKQTLNRSGILFKWIAWTGNIRAKMSKVFYGDQGIFVRKDIFHHLGGFPDVEICEDVLFTKRLKQAGRVKVLPYPIYCSARRWVKQGVLKTYLLNARVNMALTFGGDLNRVSKYYQDIR